MKVVTFRSELWLPRPRIEVFGFFSSIENLERITPSWLHFQVLTPEPVTLAVGTLIDYRICVHGIPLRWRTEITHWEPPHRFVDVQRRGPYTYWEHTHTFEEQPGGTLCRDEVRYRPPGGALVNWLWVGRDVARIFSHRQQRLTQLLGVSTVPAPL